MAQPREVKSSIVQPPNAENRGLAGLLTRARTGDLKAQTEFFNRTWKRLVAVLNNEHHVGHEDAKDIAQIILHRAWLPDTSLEITTDDAVFGWLVRGAMNLFIDKYRRNKRLPLDRYAEGGKRAASESTTEDWQVLRDALGQLEPDLRFTLTEFYKLGSSTAVAKKLGITEGAVRARCKKAECQVAEYVCHRFPDVSAAQRKYFELKWSSRCE